MPVVGIVDQLYPHESSLSDSNVSSDGCFAIWWEKAELLIFTNLSTPCSVGLVLFSSFKENFSETPIMPTLPLQSSWIGKGHSGHLQMACEMSPPATLGPLSIAHPLATLWDSQSHSLPPQLSCLSSCQRQTMSSVSCMSSCCHHSLVNHGICELHSSALKCGLSTGRLPFLLFAHVSLIVLLIETFEIYS